MRRRGNQDLLGALLLMLGIYFLLLNTNILGPIWATTMPVIVGVAFIIAYLMGQRWAIIPGTIVTAIGLVIVLAAAEIIDLDIWWPLLILAPGLSFLLLGLIRERYNLWPGAIITALGLLMLTFSTGMVVWKWLSVVGYIWPSALILIGLRLLAGSKKSNNTGIEDSHQE